MTSRVAVLVALAAGLAGGAAIAASGSATWLSIADNVAPIGTIWVNAIRMTVIPLVVSLLVTAIASAGDVRAVGRIGGRTLMVFVALLSGVAIVVMPLAVLVFRWFPRSGGALSLPPGATQAATELAASTQSTRFADWLVSLVPSNPIAAAANGAMLPLIVFTILFALAVASASGRTRETVLSFFQGLADTMLVLVRWVVAAAPIGVFGLMLPLAAHVGAGLVGAVAFYVVVYSIASIFVVLLLYPVVAMVGRVPMARFARAVLPAQLIAFSSSSSLASLPAMVQGAERELKLPTTVSGFVLPLAVSIFKLAAPVSWTIGALFVAAFYGVDLHAREIATIGLAAVFLAAASPGVPRGAFLMLTPLFLAIGLPAEGIGILIAVDAIPDLFATVLNATGDLAAAAIVARGHTAEPSQT